MPPQKAKEYFEKRSVRLPAIGRKNIETILTIPTATAISPTEFSSILNQISKHYKINTVDTMGSKIYEIQYGIKDSTLSAIYYNNIFFASNSNKLLTKILDKQIKN